ncbi:heme peroxidase [Cadophora sp. DSE1049]|nr:heme peroxidase [Cadophora sp. DSE1049]
MGWKKAQLLNGLREWATPITQQDPSTWEIGGITRGKDGRYADADLVKLLSDETEDCAGSFGGRNTPAILRAVDILGTEQGRRYGAASLNELRNFFGLTSHKSFLEVNPDPSIAAALEALYKHPDNIELHPGLVVEQAKPLITNASGLCSGETIAKAILADAVALVRGDRFYAVDSSPANLTAFGLNDIASQRNAAQGVCIHKLLQHAYPGWYTGTSVYAMFPLTVPRGPKVFDMTHHDWMLSGDKPWNVEQKLHLKTSPTSLSNSTAPNSEEATILMQFEMLVISATPYLCLKCAKLTGIVTPACKEVLQPGFDPRKMVQDVLGLGVQHTTLHGYGAALLKRIAARGKDLAYIANTVVPTAAAGGPLPAQGFAMMLDFWLQEANASLWSKVQELARDSSPAAFAKLRKYVLESLRISCTPAYGVFRICASPSATIIDGDARHEAHTGDVIFLDFLKAGTDPKKFPAPLEFNLDRPEEDYIHQGWGPHQCLGYEITFISLAVQLRCFARLKNLRRAPRPAGRLLSICQGQHSKCS